MTKNPVGPDGTARAHVGDVITTVIRVRNTDDYGDSLLITNIVDFIHHSSGTVMTSNLLVSPVLLTNFGDFVSVTNRNLVQPGDGPILQDDAQAGGIDNHDGPGGTHVPNDFIVTFPSQVGIYAPQIRVAQNCAALDTPNEPKVIYSGMISNAGAFNTTLTNVTLLSDSGTPGATNDDVITGIGTLTAGQTVLFSNAFSRSSHSITNTLMVRGTDALGLTVWDTNQCVVQVIDLAIVAYSNNTPVLQLNGPPGFNYSVQSSTNLTNWLPVTVISNATGSVRFTDFSATNDVQRFYRARRP